ncbi:hypothetical protein AV530_016429 [Patagioenas fasciata monilis]|uniref:Uncharacterized protein n=1 Tax=Patagioenas fasciata monilis TaxID=372326 RepID=A0A1V4J7E8_PATFA|nr:hypothetical protein AV530_016429 [Patagioenas fasciata monilis]
MYRKLLNLLPENAHLLAGMDITYPRLRISCATILLRSKGYSRSFGTSIPLSVIQAFVGFTIFYTYEMLPLAMTAASRIRNRCCQ